MAVMLGNHSCPDSFTCPTQIVWIQGTVFITCFKTVAGFLEKALVLANIRGFRDCNFVQPQRMPLHGPCHFTQAVSLCTVRQVITLHLLTESFTPTLTWSRYMLLKLQMAWIGI